MGCARESCTSAATTMSGPLSRHPSRGRRRDNWQPRLSRDCSRWHAGPNHDTASVASAIERLAAAGLSAKVMIDCSPADPTIARSPCGLLNSSSVPTTAPPRSAERYVL